MQFMSVRTVYAHFAQVESVWLWKCFAFFRYFVLRQLRASTRGIALRSSQVMCLDDIDFDSHRRNVMLCATLNESSAHSRHNAQIIPSPSRRGNPKAVSETAAIAIKLCD